ncbi:MAG: hydroxyacid dehydrogenase, partial [Lachnospiraceae bacterium]|nr:hydroxyacid dehydrogenase [Lachnospiraceae bacterium]
CPYPSQVIQAGKKLRIIARHGAGFDNVDIQAATRQDIWVTNVPDVTSVSVAEFTIGMILNGMRRISECHEELSAGNYAYRYSHPGRDLFGKTLGIIGLGRIGQAVAQRAYFGFGMKILAYVPRQEGKTIPDYVKIVEKEELLANSDVISIHVPGNESNRHLIGKRELKIMRADSYLVNVSRGGVVDEAALAETLHNGKIAGAALDVWMDEPKLPADELLSCKNLFLTPHIGSGSAECMDRMAMEAAGEILRVLSGSEPKHPVNLL